MAKTLAGQITGGRTRVTLRSRRPGKSSPKGRLLYLQAVPKFPVKTPQQLKIAEAGKKCGAEIRGKYPGAAKVHERRAAMAECIKKEFL